MGRFRKLETGTPAAPAAGDDPGTGRKSDGGHWTPDYDQGHYLAEADRLFYSGEYQKALRSYSRAMEVDHAAIEPWKGQILCLIKLKQTREATMWALRAIELFPEAPELVNLQGLTLALSGANQRAISCSDFAMSLPDGGTAFTWLIRAEILARADNPNAAYCYEKVKDLRNPADWRLMALAGSFLLDQKKWAMAVDFLRPAAELQPTSPWLWTLLGTANEKLGFTQPAMQAYRTALDVNPNYRPAQDAMARLVAVPLPVRLWRRLRGSR